MKKAAIIGATGFGGCGLLEILGRHPEIEVSQLFAKSEVGFKIAEMYPHLSDFYDLEVKSLEDIEYSNIDIAFFSTPDQAGMSIIEEFYKRDIPVIDYSGDFRFNSIEEYQTYAINKSMKPEHCSQKFLSEAVYGLVEKNREKLKTAKIVGNPGCFAMSLILPLLPLCEQKLIAGKTIMCDSKSGISGAGKNPGKANFYPQRHENINTYREGAHQHLVEVEQTINRKGSDYKVFFVPQVVPMTRGILSNLYITLNQGLGEEDIYKIYQEYYHNEPFVKVIHETPQSAFVRGTNNCAIRPKFDKRTGTLLVTSVIDNLMKGQSGNAVQCANIMLGLEETKGLLYPSFYP